MIQRIEQTMEEKVEMYRKMKKKRLAKMLAAANVFIDKVMEKTLREQFPIPNEPQPNVVGNTEHTYQCKDSDNIITANYLDGKPDELHISTVLDTSYIVIGYKACN